ncbi:MAG: ATPase [Kordiimonadales bacterium]|nr:MAG: ATPase [Kordiimonadales bacterium]
MPHSSRFPSGGGGSRNAPSHGPLIGHITDVTPASLRLDVDQSLAQETVGAAVLFRLGTIFKVAVADSFIFGAVCSVDQKEGSTHSLSVQIDLLGELGPSGFSRGVKTFPLPGSAVLKATNADLAIIFAPQSDDSIRIGTVFPNGDVPAALQSEALLSKHFAILGSTGTGKSTMVALLIHRMVEKHPNAHIVILDPHGEYASAFSSNGVHISTDDLALPYWLMNFEEHVELFVGRNTAGREAEIDILKNCLLSARKKAAPIYKLSRLTVDTPVPYKLTDLLQAIDASLGSLEKADEPRPYLKLRNKIEELRGDRRFAFMFSGMMVQDTLADLVSKLMRFPVEGRPISTLDLSGVPADIVDVVVSLLSRLVFDFAMWSKRHSGATPILLVCEEAHRYVPHMALDTNIQSARKSLERIAKEGRKYGVSLGLVSQRPSDLSEAVLSQCGTIISMRLNNGKDRQFVANTMPDGAGSFLAALPTLQNRECIIAGEGVACPMRVQLDFLDEHRRPASDDPHFSLAWKQDIDCLNNLVSDTIDNWRRGVR